MSLFNLSINDFLSDAKPHFINHYLTRQYFISTLFLQSNITIIFLKKFYSLLVSTNWLTHHVLKMSVFI